MGDLLLPGGGPVRFPTRHDPDPDDDLDEFVVCADCETHVLVGDEEVCPICKKPYCEECIEDHDCGFLQAQAEASFL